MPGSFKLLTKLLTLTLVLLSLVGCAARVSVPESAEISKIPKWEQHLARMSDIDHWSCWARIAIRLQREGFSASLHWWQRQEDYALRLIAPLGRGTFELNGDQDGVSLRTADDGVLYAKDAESLMQAHLGWHVPVSALGYWIRGLTQPDVPVASFILDEQGRMRELSQSGWRVSYKSYLDKDRYALPGKLSLHKGELELRLAIRQWELP